MSQFIYGKRSLGKVMSCHPRMQEIAKLAITLTPIDFTIVHGWRGEEEQNELVRLGMSKTPWPTSMHNKEVQDIIEDEPIPWSMAIDFAPLVDGKIPWKDTHTFAVIAGVWFAAAEKCDTKLRWGGDWDMDGLTTDQTFMDYGHVELRL